MSVVFSEDEVTEIKEMVKDSYASSISGVELTYGENLVALVTKEETKKQLRC